MNAIPKLHWLQFLPYNYTIETVNSINTTLTTTRSALTQSTGLREAGYDALMELNENTTAPLSLTDAATCLMYLFDPTLQNETKNAIVEKMNSVLSSNVDDDLSKDQQNDYCRAVTCQLAGQHGKYGDVDCECDLNTTVGDRLTLSVSIDLMSSIEHVLETIRIQNATDRALQKEIDEQRLPHLIKAFRASKELRKQVVETTASMSNNSGEDALWPNKRSMWLDSLAESVTNYTKRGVSFKTLSDQVVERYRNDFALHTSQLANLMDKLDDMNSQRLVPIRKDSEFLLSLQNASSNDDSGHCVYHYAKTNFLWKNDTNEYLHHIHDRVIELQQYVNETLEELRNESALLTKAVHALFDDVDRFLERSKVNDDFYINNFINLNIAFSTLELYTVAQEKTYNFWTFLSNFGGTTGLYNGFCIIVVFQVLDVIIRKCCVQRNIWGCQGSYPDEEPDRATNFVIDMTPKNAVLQL